jgi:competence protein ComEC
MRYFFLYAKVLAFAAIFALGASCTCVFGDAPEDPEPLRVTFIDVGQGLAVLLDYGGRYAMYDMGPDSAGVLDTLAARGVDTLEWVLLSHNHRDHAGGFMEIAGSVRVGDGLSQVGDSLFRVGDAPLEVGSFQVGDAPRVYVRRLYVGPDTSGGFIRDSVLTLARGYGIPVDTLVRGDAFGLFSGSGDAPRFDVLWPPDYVREGGNPASVVVRVEFGAASLLLTGDLDSAGERRLLVLSPTLSAGLLQVPHHGSAGSSSLRFISRVAPDYAVVSVGAGNAYGHPREEVVRKYAYVLGDTARFFRTDLQGSVAFEMWPDIGVVVAE